MVGENNQNYSGNAPGSGFGLTSKTAKDRYLFKAEYSVNKKWDHANRVFYITCLCKRRDFFKSIKEGINDTNELDETCCCGS